MGSTFTAGGNVSSVSGADYDSDSRGNLRNGFVALLLSGNSCDGDGVCGDDDEVRGNGDGVRGDGNGVRGDGNRVRGDGDGVRGDDHDVHRDTAGDVEHRWRELSDDARILGDDEHEGFVGQGDGEQGDDEYDEAEQDDEGHADDPSTVDGRLSLELEQQIIEAAEKMLRQTPRNSIDTWVLYRRLLRYRQLRMFSRAVACALAMQMRDHEQEILRGKVPDIRFYINRLSEKDCINRFRFRKVHLAYLLMQFRLPPFFSTQEGYRVSGIEAMCITLEEKVSFEGILSELDIRT
uniref:Uncharacterized protein n=1 Tax=Phytophthora fragariae TaxID=53985 RepID=A0A6A3DNE9_9STRA|nr:hypothetical protein PF009_g29059 [Phytophthora fragariae]